MKKWRGWILFMLLGTGAGLDITKPGWCILSPANGEVVVPEDLGGYQPVEVRLLQSNSKQRNTEDCIARLIETAANRPRSAAAGQKPEPIDLPRELRTWAAQKDLQLTDEQARAALDRWLREAEAQRSDPHMLGLARFAKNQFAEARLLFLRAAKEEKQHRAQATERMVQDYRLAGDAAMQELNFDAALTAYQEASDRLQSLRATLAAQPAQRAAGWSFAPVKTFLLREARLATHRGFLLELITAVEKPDRAACLAALDAVIAHQPETPPR